MRNGCRWIMIIAVMMLVLGVCLCARADRTGSGTEGSPWVVDSWGDLQAAFDDGGYVKLGAGITAGGSDTYLRVNKGKTIILDLNGHTLSRGLTESTGGDRVLRITSGNLTIRDNRDGQTGVVTGGKVYGNGGGVYIEGGSLTLESGSISGNTASGSNGGGVYVTGSATFEMKGGSISGNQADITGGGVGLDSGAQFTMSGGEISRNQAGYGGGVDLYCDNGGQFTMNGGRIFGNAANGKGGGVCIENGTFEMKAGSITGNSIKGFGGGVNVDKGTFKIYGNAVITGNVRDGTWNDNSGYTGDTASNIYLWPGRKITVADVLSTNHTYGVDQEGNPGVFTDGYPNTNPDTEPDTCFISDNPALAVRRDASGEAKMVETYTAVFSVGSGGCVTTINNQTTAAAGDSVVLAVTPQTGYALSSITVTYKGNKTVALTQGSGADANQWSFTMPASNVTVTAVFSEWKWLQEQFAKGGTITLTGDYRDTLNEGWLEVPSGKTVQLNLAGHIIDRGRTGTEYNGNVITVYGALKISDTAPTAAHTPAVTYNDPVTGQSVTVKGGIITGGKGTFFGGGVYIYGEENSQVYGDLIMSGGTICGNTSASGGGGIYLGRGAALTMSGGAVSGNTSESIGGGVCVDFGGHLTMRGGKITGNISSSDGGGLYMTYWSFMQISGSPVISGNKRGTENNNVYLSSSMIDAVGQLTNTVPIGITLDPDYSPIPDKPVVFTSGLSGKGTAVNFASDNPAYGVRLNGDGEAMLAVKGTITVQDPTAHGTLTVTTADPDGLAGEADKACPGDTVTVTLVPNSGWIPGTLAYTLEGGARSAVAFAQRGEKYSAGFVMPAAASMTLAVYEAFGDATFVLPAETTAIEAGAFSGDTGITAVDARNCTSIGAEAFSGCTGLTKILLPQSCISIAPTAFSGTVHVFALPGGTTESICNDEAYSNLVFVPWSPPQNSGAGS